MGYSCSAKSDYVLTALMVQLQVGYKKRSSNSWEFGGREFFYEIGRENADGAITGNINKINPVDATCKRVGTFRIEQNGKITRWATSTASQRSAAETKGLIDFCTTYNKRWEDEPILQKNIKGAKFVVV